MISLLELQMIRRAIDRAIGGNEVDSFALKVMMRRKQTPSKCALRGASEIVEALIRYTDHQKKGDQE